MSEHTPGPWKAIKVSGTWVIVDWEDKRQRRRTSETIGGAYTRTHGTEEEHTANAHLIAAAPDLLAALETINTWLIAPALDQATLEEISTLVKAAIHKTQGRANT